MHHDKLHIPRHNVILDCAVCISRRHDKPKGIMTRRICTACYEILAAPLTKLFSCMTKSYFMSSSAQACVSVRKKDRAKAWEEQVEIVGVKQK